MIHKYKSKINKSIKKHKMTKKLTTRKRNNSKRNNSKRNNNSSKNKNLKGGEKSDISADIKACLAYASNINEITDDTTKLFSSKK